MQHPYHVFVAGQSVAAFADLRDAMEWSLRKGGLVVCWPAAMAAAEPEGPVAFVEPVVQEYPPRPRRWSGQTNGGG